MYLLAAAKLTKKARLFLPIVAYAFGLLLLNGCKDHLGLVKQQLAETDQQSLAITSKSDLALKTVNTTVTPSSTGTAENLEFDSVSTNNTGPDYQATAYQASALPSPFKVANFRPANFIDPSIQSNSVEDQLRDQSNWTDKKQDQLLSKFQYRGRIATVNEVSYGLIQRPDGIIMKVKVGQSLGQESMRVIEITPTQINLVEQGVAPGAGVTAKRLTLIAPMAP